MLFLKGYGIIKTAIIRKIVRKEKKMKQYKIIASDLDGTLLNDNAEISNENAKAIKMLVQKGVYFVPSSGRTYSEIPKELQESEDIRYLIHSNGAVVLDKKTGKRILSCLSRELSHKVWDIVTSYDTHLTVRYDGRCFVDRRFQTAEHYQYYNICIPHQVVVRDFAEHLDNFEETIRAKDQIEVYSVFFHNPDERAACRKEIESIAELIVVDVDPNNLEIVSSNAGKGKALYALADMLGIDREETIAVGDSDNDKSIVKAAGLGLAVENACVPLKEIADETICSNEEHVMVYILEHYFK